MRSREAVLTGAQTAASWPNCPRNRTSTPCCGPTMATWRQESGAPFLVSNSHQGNCGLTCPFRPPRVSSTRITQFSYKGGSKATWAAPFHLRRQWRGVGCWLSPYLFRGGLVFDRPPTVPQSPTFKTTHIRRAFCRAKVQRQRATS